MLEYPGDVFRLNPTPEGFYRVDPLPSEEELAEYYMNEYYKKNRAIYKQEYTEEEIGFFISKIERRIGILKNMLRCKPNTCLDIACGEGWGLRVYEREGWEVTGLDFSTDACLVHNPGYVEKIITGSLYDTLDDLARQDKKYQVLNLDNILEHARDPYALLEGCKKVMESDGAIVIEVPNSDSKHYQYLFNRGITNWRLACMAYPDHLSYFNIDSLRNLCDHSGFQEAAILNLQYYNMKINSRPAYIDDYLDTCPFDKLLRYYSAMAELGMGSEIVGFWGVK